MYLVVLLVNLAIISIFTLAIPCMLMLGLMQLLSYCVVQSGVFSNAMKDELFCQI